MNFKDTSFFNNLSDEDKLLVSKISDWIIICENSYVPKFSFFLDERQCELLESFLIAMKFNSYEFYGGYENAKRKVLAILPPNFELELSDFPIKAISFTYRKTDILRHRDFLGAIMSNKIKRETIGDISIFDGVSYVLMYETISEYIYNNVSKIGSVGVKLSYDVSFDFNPSENYLEIKGSVASLRLDSIVSLATKLSREKAVSLIKSVGIVVNYVNINSASNLLKEGDIFSIRGYGKFKFTNINGISKKQRVHISIIKYI